MANWQYPTGAYKAYVPKGQGWKRAGQSMQQFGQNFAAQMIAIKQFEAEQEAKRQKAEQERMQAQLKAAMDAEKMAWAQQKWAEEKELRERSLKTGEFAAKSLADYRTWQKEKQEKEEDLANTVDAIFKELGGVQSPVAERYASIIMEAWDNQDLGKINQAMTQAPHYAKQMKYVKKKITTKEGDEQEVEEATKDLFIVRNAARRLLAIGGQMGWEKKEKGYGYSVIPQPSPSELTQKVAYALSIDEMMVQKVIDALYADEKQYLQMKKRSGIPQEMWDAIENQILVEQGK
jgi:hypothetical protein